MMPESGCVIAAPFGAISAVFFGRIERASIDQMTLPLSWPSPDARKTWLARASPAMMRNKWLDRLTHELSTLRLPLVVLGSARGHAIHKADDRALIGMRGLSRDCGQRQ
jgi:hypothetical protein